MQERHLSLTDRTNLEM